MDEKALYKTINKTKSRDMLLFIFIHVTVIYVFGGQTHNGEVYKGLNAHIDYALAGHVPRHRLPLPFNAQHLPQVELEGDLLSSRYGRTVGGDVTITPPPRKRLQSQPKYSNKNKTRGWTTEILYCIYRNPLLYIVFIFRAHKIVRVQYIPSPSP